MTYEGMYTSQNGFPPHDISTAREGLYLARCGDEAIAQRDRFERLCLSTTGSSIYRRAIVRYRSDGDEAALEREVLRAVRT